MPKLVSVEKLESRQHFTISVINHVLNVQGAPGQPNTITIGLNSGGNSIFAEITTPTAHGSHIKHAVFPLTRNFRFVSINGGNRADLITVDQSNGLFNLLTHINTRGGNDTVHGGSESDRIVCGNGIDAVISGDGNDSIYAGRGPDTLVGGNGNDVLHAGRGHDLLVVGNGSSAFVDPFGHNTLQGGDGHDLYIIKEKNLKLDVTPTYDPAKDTLKEYLPRKKNSNSILNDVLNAVLDYYL